MSEVEQVFDEPPHAVGFFADDAAGLARAFGARDRAIDERTSEPADRRERRAQIVADVGQEIPHGAMRAGDFAGHDGERLGQAAHLVGGVGQGEVQFQVAARHLFRGAGDLDHRLGDRRGEPPGDADRDQQRQQRGHR